MMKKVIFALLVLALPLHAADDPASVVGQFYVSYAAGDVAGAAELWDPDAGRAFAERAQHHFRVRCLQHGHIAVATPVVSGAKASVDVDTPVLIWSEAPGTLPHVELRRTTFDLARTDRWRITRWVDRESLLADRIAAMKTAEERKALLDDAGALRTPRLAEELCIRAVTAANGDAFGNAEALIRAAQEVAIETGDDAAMARILAEKSRMLFWGPNQYAQRGIEVADEALSYAARSGDVDAIARAALQEGRAQLPTLGHVMREPQERVLALAEYVDDVTILADAATMLAFASTEMNNPTGQVRYGMLALRWATMTGNQESLYNAHFTTGEGFARLGYAQVAKQHYEAMVEIAKRIGTDADVAHASTLLVRSLFTLGRHDETLAIVERSLPAAAANVKANLLVSRSAVRFLRNDLAGSIADLREALRNYRPGHSARAHAIARLSVLLALDRQYAEAVEVAREAVRTAGVLPPREQAGAAGAEAFVLRKAGRFDEARARNADVQRMTDEQTATTAVDERALGQVFAQMGDGIESAALAIDTGDAVEALRSIHRLKGRGLRAFLDRRANLASLRMNDLERARERDLEARIATLNKQLLGARSGKQIAALQKEVAQARIDLDVLRATAASERGAPLPPTQSEDPLVLATDDVVVQYAYAEDGLLIVAMSPGEGAARQVIAKRISLLPHVIEKKTEELLELLNHRDLRYNKAAAEMFDLLLEPVRPLLGSGRMLCIVPYGDLWRLPFQALRAPDGRYLGEIAPVYYTPSLELARHARPPRPAAPTLLALANPQLDVRSVSRYRTAFAGTEVGALPDAEDEVRAVARLYGRERSRVYVGEEATEATLKSQTGHFDVIHIATHGAADVASPLASAILLAPGRGAEDGILEAREVLDLALKSDLAVLAACSTGDGQAARGEGIIGMSWAFLATGCPTTVVSQWQATSSVTSRMMIELHRRLRAGDPAAIALQKAQSLVRKDARYRHPYYWAPFVVVGAQ